MKLTIVEKKENPLLKRTDVVGRVVFEGSTPSNADIAAAIGQEVKGEVVVKKIDTHFSKQDADVVAVVYADVDAREKAERLTKHIKKQREAAAKKAAEEKAAAEEKPAEEPAKEEASEEKTEEASE